MNGICNFYKGLIDNERCHYQNWAGKSLSSTVFDLLFSKCTSGEMIWESRTAFFGYNEYSFVAAQPGIMACRIKNTKIYGWGYDSSSPCMSNDNFSFRRILQRQVNAIEILSLGSCIGMVEEEYTEWTEWTACSDMCGHGTRQRTQTCSTTQCSFRGDVHLEEEQCADVSECTSHGSNQSKCPIFFGEGFAGYNHDSSMLARSCTVDGHNITSFAKYDHGLPNGTHCRLSCLSEYRLSDSEFQGTITCINGSWDNIPHCVSRGIFAEHAPDETGTSYRH